MLARSSRSFLWSSRSLAGAVSPITSPASPSIISNLHTRRTFSSSTTTLNTTQSQTTPSEDGEDKPSPFLRLDYVLTEGAEPSHQTLISRLEDHQLTALPIVISSSPKWAPLPSEFTLPRRSRSHVPGTAPTSRFCSEYVYNTFSFETSQHLKRFHAEIAAALIDRANMLHPVVLMDSRTKTLTLGLQSYVGLEPPYPAYRNQGKVTALINDYRNQKTNEENKSKIAKELRKYLVPYGFQRRSQAFNLYAFGLYETLRNLTAEEVETVRLEIANGGKVEIATGERAKIASDVTRSEGRRERAEKKGESREGKKEKEPRRTPAGQAGGRKPNPADNMQADDPRLPEAGTFVAQDGNAFKSTKGVDELQERVPFPTPSAEEMGIKKPTEGSHSHSADLWSADNPKLPEAGTFVAQDGDAHKPSKGVDDLQEHVPFPTPSAEEMGMEKPVGGQQSGSENLQDADNPKLPEAGTFVAQDGGAHKPSKGVDSLQEHVPFPTPSAEEMGIKKPIE